MSGSGKKAQTPGIEMHTRVGVYVRESRDENGRNRDTIETQKSLLCDFASKYGLGCVTGIYEDDNVSGSVFEREGLDRLKDDVLSGKLDVLLLKDLSRLGRSNALTLLFLDFLEERGVRVVTCDGRYDSTRDNETVGIETWANERYIRDISKKIRASLRHKIEKGEYIGKAPYGYVKSPETKNRLIPAAETAPVVLEIFRLYTGGMGLSAISHMLNSRGAAPPGHPQRRCDTCGVWRPSTVRRILGNRAYIGDTVQGVSEKTSFRSGKTRRIPEEKWIVTQRTHEAIIRNDLFELAQGMLRSCKRTVPRTDLKAAVFSGIFRCGRCGSTMVARRRKNRPAGYVCSLYNRAGSRACSSHHVKEDAAVRFLLQVINSMLDDKHLCGRVSTMLKMRMDAGKERETGRLRHIVSEKQRQQDVLYADRLCGRISVQQFARLNNAMESRLAELRREYSLLCGQDAGSEPPEGLLSKLSADIKTGKVGSGHVHRVIRNATVFDAGDIESGVNGVLLPADECGAPPASRTIVWEMYGCPDIQGDESSI